jgi:hypothetical protein
MEDTNRVLEEHTRRRPSEGTVRRLLLGAAGVSLAWFPCVGGLSRCQIAGTHLRSA